MPQSFPETRWTLIQRARTDVDPSLALEEWCQNYHPPVYSYICAQGYNADTAKELAQSFFERLLTRGLEESLPGQLKGAFRAYLTRAVKNFLTDQWRATQTKRKGGGTFQTHPEELDHIHDHAAMPDQAFDQNWALTVLNLAMNHLKEEMEKKGNLPFFEAAKGLLDGRAINDEDRQALATSLGMKDGAFRVALHRLRGRFRALIEEEIRETVSNEEDFQEELRYLLQVWS